MALTDQQVFLPKDPASDLERRLAEVVGLLNVCTAEMIDLIAEALRTGAWAGFGIRSPEHWVTWKCGVSSRRAHRLVALARRLADLPDTSRLFRNGELTEDQVSVIVRHTDADHDAQVASLAPSLTVPQLNRVLPSVPRSEPAMESPDTTVPRAFEEGGTAPVDGEAGDAPAAPRDLGRRRDLAMGYDDDGGFWCSIHLPGDEGALVERALVEARQAEFMLRHPDADRTGEATAVSWSDALLRLVDAALNGLQPTAVACRTPGDRTQVIVHLDADAGTPPRLHLGPVLPVAIAEYLSCDATIRYQLERNGVPVARGRRRRTVGAALRTAIEHRDQGCRVPGCGHKRWLHVHHIVHWSRGGRTDPDNLVALCTAHHRMLHKGELRVSGDPGTADSLRWHDRDGRELLPSFPRPPDRPVADAARAYGLPEPGWEHPCGERLESRWLAWD